MKKVKRVINMAQNRQRLSAIESDLEKLRDDCDQRINQCRRRLKAFPEIEVAGTTGTVTKQQRKRVLKAKPPARPGRAGYGSSFTGIPANA